MKSIKKNGLLLIQFLTKKVINLWIQIFILKTT